MTAPGWYPVGDGLSEAFWEGSTWIEGSKRPLPPKARLEVPSPPTSAPAVPTPTEKFGARVVLIALMPLMWAVATATTIGLSGSEEDAMSLATFAVALGMLAWGVNGFLVSGDGRRHGIPWPVRWLGALLPPIYLARRVERGTRLTVPGWLVGTLALVVAAGVVATTTAATHSSNSDSGNGGTYSVSDLAKAFQIELTGESPFENAFVSSVECDSPLNSVGDISICEVTMSGVSYGVITPSDTATWKFDLTLVDRNGHFEVHPEGPES